MTNIDMIELNFARDQLADMEVRLDDALGILSQLMRHLESDGEYRISRKDGTGICIGEAVMFGNLFERATKLLEAHNDAH